MHTLRTLFAFLACALLAGCTAAPAQQPASPLPVGTPVPFAVLMTGNDLTLDFEHELDEKQIVLTSVAQAEAISPPLLPEVIDALRSVNFDRYTAILLSMGAKSSNGYRVETRGIYRSGGILNGYVTYWYPNDEMAVGETFTIPFQTVVVPRGAVIHEGEVAEIVLHTEIATPIAFQSARP
jgi:hypothetical protein